jgi:cobaltochelatase CobN
MHLLAATPGTVDDGQEPVDLGQTPADVVVISAADTELAALSEARAEMPKPPALRLANLTHLKHPMSVDLHIDQCATKSRLVIARLLGGLGYWRYGAEQYAARLHAAGIPLALLPGDDKEDAELRRLSTVPTPITTRSGPISSKAAPRTPPISSPTPATCWTARGATCRQTAAARRRLLARHRRRRPRHRPRRMDRGRAGRPHRLLPRAGAGRRPEPDQPPDPRADAPGPEPAAHLRRLAEGPGQRRHARPPLHRNPARGHPQRHRLRRRHARRQRRQRNPLASPRPTRRPVFQVVLAGSSEDAWATGSPGLSARDIAMNVALPEVDGRILSRAVSFKGEAFFDEATECPIAAYRARGDRIDFVASSPPTGPACAAPAPTAASPWSSPTTPTRTGGSPMASASTRPPATVHVLLAWPRPGYTVDDAPHETAPP